MNKSVYTSRHDEVRVTTCCAHKPYLELRLPGDAVSIKRITVTLSSRDQGWCSDPHLVSKGGFTWFELNVETSGGRNYLPRKCIYQNPAGVAKRSEKRFVWDRTHEQADFREFAAHVKPYDIVQLIPRAQFDGWVNFVHRAELKIEYSSHHSQDDDVPRSNIRYSRLRVDGDTKNIRLLNLLPGEEMDPLIVTLTTCDVSLEQTEGETMPQYEALSYCWGELHSTALLRVLEADGSTTVAYISQNLFQALLQFRRTMAGRLLWIDQICINQADRDELSEQVGMMGLIYSRASSVVIWLGEGDPVVERSIDEVNRLFPHFQKPTTEQLRLGTFRGHLPDVTDQTMPLAEVSCVLSLPWFWRVWVVQESVRAREHVFMYGRRTLNWDTIQKANMWTKLDGFELPWQPHIVLPSIWSSMETEGGIESGNHPAEMDLLTMFVRGLNLRATDPRDHIFGLLGLCDDIQHEKQFGLLTRPDYSKSVSEAFSDFTLHYAQQNLRVLSAVHALRGRTWRSLGDSLASSLPASPERRPRESPPADHPTWALWYDGSTEWANETLGLSDMYHVTGDSEIPQPVFRSEERKQLVVSGYRLGRLNSIEPYCRPSDMTSDTSRAFTRLFNRSTNRQFHDFSGLGDPHQQKLVPHNPGGHWYAHLGEHGLPSVLPCANDCYFRASNDLCGLCPDGTKASDVVVILYGGPVPYLIRETEVEGQYTFVGECFLEGKMEQNLLQPFEEAATLPETFILV